MNLIRPPLISGSPRCGKKDHARSPCRRPLQLTWIEIDGAGTPLSDPEWVCKKHYIRKDPDALAPPPVGRSAGWAPGTTRAQRTSIVQANYKNVVL